MKSVQVIGLGYVGLPTAILAAQTNQFQIVKGCDVNKELIHDLTNQLYQSEEPGLTESIHSEVKRSSIEFSTEVETADIHIIAVPTPTHKKTNLPDLRIVKSVIERLCEVLKKGDLVIVESTCPPGTTRQLSEIVFGLRPDLISEEEQLLHFSYCPERVLPGNALAEIKKNSRVIGGLTKRSAEKAKEFYSTFICADIDISEVAEEAELSKLAENAFRDVNIAFANELSMMCGDRNVDVHKVIQFANRHPRVNILLPGAGVGGHCIAVDPWFLIDWYPKSELLKAARKANLEKEHWVVRQILKKCKIFSIREIILLGLTYKPNVGDFRESPGLRILEELQHKSELKITGVDPYATEMMNIDTDVDINKKTEVNTLVVKLQNHNQFEHLNENTVINYLDFT